MRRLLSAGLAGLRKNKVLWACILGAFLSSLCIILNGARRNALFSVDRPLDHYFFNFLPMVGFLWAAFSGLYVGADYDHGLLRNKLVVGHTRVSVYLANLAVSIAAAILVLAAWFVGGLAGIPFLGSWSMSWPQLVCVLGLSLLTTASFCAILMAVEMSIPSRAISAVVSLGLALGLLFCASSLYNALCEQEFIEGYVFVNGAIQPGATTPNPNYVAAGTKRTLFLTLLNVLPTGQHILIADNDWGMMNLPLMAGGSLGLAVLATLGGLMVFRRQNIK